MKQPLPTLTWQQKINMTPDGDSEADDESNDLSTYADEAFGPGSGLGFGRKHKACKKNQYMSPSKRCRLRKNRPCKNPNNLRNPKTLKCRSKKGMGPSLAVLQNLALTSMVPIYKKLKDGSYSLKTAVSRAVLKVRLTKAGVNWRLLPNAVRRGGRPRGVVGGTRDRTFGNVPLSQQGGGGGGGGGGGEPLMRLPYGTNVPLSVQEAINNSRFGF
jgi:hypothetical protein